MGAPAPMLVDGVQRRAMIWVLVVWSYTIGAPAPAVMGTIYYGNEAACRRREAEYRYIAINIGQGQRYLVYCENTEIPTSRGDVNGRP